MLVFQMTKQNNDESSESMNSNKLSAIPENHHELSPVTSKIPMSSHDCKQEYSKTDNVEFDDYSIESHHDPIPASTVSHVDPTGISAKWSNPSDLNHHNSFSATSSHQPTDKNGKLFNMNEIALVAQSKIKYSEISKAI